MTTLHINAILCTCLTAGIALILILKGEIAAGAGLGASIATIGLHFAKTNNGDQYSSADKGKTTSCKHSTKSTERKNQHTSKQSGKITKE